MPIVLFIPVLLLLQTGQETTGASGPLSKLDLQMQEVAAGLELGETGTSTQRQQQQILEQLDRHLEQLRRGQSSSRAVAESAGQGKPQGGETSSPSQREAESSMAEELSAGAPPPADVKVSEEVWGHLPGRIRSELRSATIERFLPKYEGLIEAYYRRLAEEPSR